MIRRPPRSTLLSLHDALPICHHHADRLPAREGRGGGTQRLKILPGFRMFFGSSACLMERIICTDRKSTRLNSSHLVISYAVFCLKKKKTNICPPRRPLAESDT